MLYTSIARRRQEAMHRTRLAQWQAAALAAVERLRALVGRLWRAGQADAALRFARAARRAALYAQRVAAALATR